MNKGKNWIGPGSLKTSIDIGLAIGSSPEWQRRLRRQQRWAGRQGGWLLREIADRCNCTWAAIYLIEKQALAKVRQRLAERGISKVEVLMIGEMMSKQGSYRHPNE